MTGRPLLAKPARKAHWAIHLLYALCREHMMARAEMARRAGMHPKTAEQWWRGDAVPGIMMIEACLGVFGVGLKPSTLGHRLTAKQEKLVNDSAG